MRHFRQFFYLLCILLPWARVEGQTYILSNSIPVDVAGSQLRAAWAGGLSAGQFNEIDLNNDGLMDLVIFDRVDAAVLTFINRGTPNQVDYDFDPGYIAAYPPDIRDWMLHRDFDNDGFADIFCSVSQSSNIRVYRNTSSSTGGVLSFALYKDTLWSAYPPYLPLYSARSDLPAVIDVDGDGDLDILTFQIAGNRVEWHKNMSVENTGGLTLLEFELQSRCFGHFEEDLTGCTATIGLSPCGPGERVSAKRTDHDWNVALAKTLEWKDHDWNVTAAKTLERKAEALDPQFRSPAAHSGSTILALDLNGDGLKELIIGDVGCQDLYALFNGGTAQIAHFDSIQTAFPAYDLPVNVLDFPAAFFLDIDNDGKADLISSPNANSQIEDRSSVQLHKNTGSNQVPVFSFQKYGFIQDEMIETGSGSMPAFLDYDGDGLLDLLIGNIGNYVQGLGFRPSLSLFRNTGTSNQPAYSLVSGDYLALSGHPAFQSASWLHPAPGDLDGDGDVDLLLGSSDGKLFYFQNTGGSGNPANFSFVTDNYAGIDAGFNSAPQLLDLDGDFDLDMLVGNHRGYVQFYRNTGTQSSAVFTHVTDSFGLVKVNDFSGQSFSNGYSRPFAFDYDLDGDLDLLVGTREGPIHVYENISLVPQAAFPRVADLFGRSFGNFSALAAATLDPTGPTFVFGDMRGGLMMMRREGPVHSPGPMNYEKPSVTLFPNPTSGFLNYRVVGGIGGGLSTFSIFNSLGSKVVEGKTTGPEGTINLRGLQPGVYSIVFQSRYGSQTYRIVRLP